MSKAKRSFSFKAKVYSPRWGRQDTYTIALSEDELSIDNGNMKSAHLKIVEGNPEWTGHNQGIGNPLMMTFHNDSIYAPDIVPRALEHGYEEWLDHEVEDDVLKTAVLDLFAWIDKTAQSKPRGYWQSVF